MVQQRNRTQIVECASKVNMNSFNHSSFAVDFSASMIVNFIYAGRHALLCFNSRL